MKKNSIEKFVANLAQKERLCDGKSKVLTNAEFSEVGGDNEGCSNYGVGCVGRNYGCTNYVGSCTDALNSDCINGSVDQNFTLNCK